MFWIIEKKPGSVRYPALFIKKISQSTQSQYRPMKYEIALNFLFSPFGPVFLPELS